MNNTSHAVRATQPLTSGNEGDVWDMNFCIDLVLSHSLWPVCCLTLLMLTVLLVLECLNLLICLQLFLQHHLICIAARGWFFPCYCCYSHSLGKAVVEFNEDNCPVLTRQAAILERAELVLERVLECTWAFSAMITPRKYKKKLSEVRECYLENVLLSEENVLIQINAVYHIRHSRYPPIKMTLLWVCKQAQISMVCFSLSAACKYNQFSVIYNLHKVLSLLARNFITVLRWCDLHAQSLYISFLCIDLHCSQCEDI